MALKRFAWLVTLLVAVTPLAAQGGYYDDEGFFVFLDGVLTQPADTDQVLGLVRQLPDPAAPAPVQFSSPAAVEWDEELGSRVGAGYRWGPNRVSVSYWQFEHDQRLAFDGPAGGYVNFTIGPAFYIYSGVYYPVYNVGSPGFVDFAVDLEASTVDLAYEHTHQLNDVFDFEWSVGLRYATFEEKMDGAYDVCATTGCEGFYAAAPFNFVFGDVGFDVTKSNEGDMAGVRVGIGGSFYATPSFLISGELAVSELTGEVTSLSSLVPTGAVNGVDPVSTAFVEDKDRSGSIRDVGMAVEWALVNNRLRIALGYRHSRWDGIATDLLRNPPGLLTPNKDRDHVTFAGPYLGVRYDF